MAKSKTNSPAEPERPLRLEWRSPAELAENPANWRIHPEAQLAALSDVIADVGFAGACLFNEATGRLIDGHARKKVALDQGAELVPVLVGSWSEEQERKILATLDPLSAMAEADAEKLAALLAEIDTESEAVQELLDSLAHDNPPPLPEPGAGGDEFDATPQDGPTRTQPGDLWLIGGKHRLLVGDCTDAGNVLLLLDGSVPHLMVTDPPYGVEYDPSWRAEVNGDGPESKRAVGKVLNDDRADWREAWALFPGDVAYVWHAGVFSPQVAESLAACEFEMRALIVWAKNKHTFGRGHYHHMHEPCWYAVRKSGTGHWTGDRKQTTLWKIDTNRNNDTGHGTQKPVECMKRPIENNSKPGDAVYDPFLGSGTTLIAAHRLGRVCYGCEIEPRYGDVILKRAEAEGLTCEKVGDA